MRTRWSPGFEQSIGERNVVVALVQEEQRLLLAHVSVGVLVEQSVDHSQVLIERLAALAIRVEAAHIWIPAHRARESIGRAVRGGRRARPRRHHGLVTGTNQRLGVG